jgi:hypothetical protein
MILLPEFWNGIVSEKAPRIFQSNFEVSQKRKGSTLDILCMTPYRADPAEVPGLQYLKLAFRIQI